MEAIARLLGALRGISSVLLLFVLLYVYAGLPELVGLSSDESGSSSNFVTRNTFFYASLLFFVLINAGFYILIQLLRKRRLATSEMVLIWWNGLGTLINIFFIASLTFISAFNSLEKLDLGNFGLVILVLLVVIAIWIVGVIFVYIYQKRQAESGRY